LPARWVIHTVGPVWQGGRRGEEEVLRNCYRHSLMLAEHLGADTVAFPSIATGVYGYPLERAVPVAVSEVTRHLQASSALSAVTFVAFDVDTHAAYSRALRLD
jgi:O-acetyl-ADP-ribose deacetylase (regulator of RNase III)